jgi:hypothetical protein
MRFRCRHSVAAVIGYELRACQMRAVQEFSPDAKGAFRIGNI